MHPVELTYYSKSELADKAARLLKEKKDLEKAARELLAVTKDSLPPDGASREKYESAILTMETLLGA